MTLIPPVARDLRIQPVACCIFRHQGSLLVLETIDPESRQIRYDLPGGKLVFGEYSWESVRKQIRQTLNLEIKDLTFMGPAEHVAMQGEAPVHEITFMFEGSFVNRNAYQKELKIASPAYTKATWIPLTAFKRKKAHLRKDWLLDML